MRDFLRKKKQGSAMIGAIIVSILAGVMMAAGMGSLVTEHKMSKRYLDAQHALNLAESGLEEAVRAYNSSTWTGWTSHADGYSLTLQPNWLSNGLTGEMKMYVNTTPGALAVAAEGKVTDARGSSVSRQILVNMTPSTSLANGMLSKTTVKFSGGNVTVDSYDSTKGPRSDTFGGYNRFSNGNVASMSVEADQVDIGNGKLYGYLAIGASTYDPDRLVGPKGLVHAHNYVAPPGSSHPNIDPSRVTADFKASLLPTPTPSYAAWPDVPASTSLGTAGGAMEYYKSTGMEFSGGSHLNIVGPTTIYVYKDPANSKSGHFKVSGNTELKVASGAELILYVEGDVDITGNGIVNGNSQPEKCLIYGMATAAGGQTIKIAGNGDTKSVIYAPNANVEIKGGGNELSDGLCGAVVGHSIKMTGNQRFSYDENLKNFSSGSRLKITSWRELRNPSEQLPFDTPSQIGDVLASL